LSFRFMADHCGEWPVAWACDALEVSESGFYAWAGRPPAQADLRRDQLVVAIEQVHAEVKGR
jgi:putative transposase